MPRGHAVQSDNGFRVVVVQRAILLRGVVCDSAPLQRGAEDFHLDVFAGCGKVYERVESRRHGCNGDRHYVIVVRTYSSIHLLIHSHQAMLLLVVVVVTTTHPQQLLLLLASSSSSLLLLLLLLIVLRITEIAGGARRPLFGSYG